MPYLMLMDWLIPEDRCANDKNLSIEAVRLSINVWCLCRMPMVEENLMPKHPSDSIVFAVLADLCSISIFLFFFPLCLPIKPLFSLTFGAMHLTLRCA